MEKNREIFSTLIWLLALGVLGLLWRFEPKLMTRKLDIAVNTDNYAAEEFVVTEGFQLSGEKAIGKPSLDGCDSCCASLGHGFIALKLAKPIINRSGRDLRVYEVDDHYEWDNQKNLRPDSYEVEVSDNGVSWHFLGYGYGVTDFDFSKLGIGSVQYVKIKSFQPTVREGYLGGEACIDAVEALSSGW